MQNTSPIFPLVPSIQWGAADGNGGAAGPLKTANTAKDGTGTVLTVYTVHATDSSRVDYLKVRAAGSNVATVLRIFINNGLTNATVGNNTLFMERTIPATTLSEVAELADIMIPLDISPTPGHKINVTIGTSVAAGLWISGVGGHYAA
jgi:hypothetical protein